MGKGVRYPGFNVPDGTPQEESYLRDENGIFEASIDRVNAGGRQYKVLVAPLGSDPEEHTIFGTLNSVKNFVRGKLGDGN